MTTKLSAKEFEELRQNKISNAYNSLCEEIRKTIESGKTLVCFRHSLGDLSYDFRDKVKKLLPLEEDFEEFKLIITDCRWDRLDIEISVPTSLETKTKIVVTKSINSAWIMAIIIILFIVAGCFIGLK